MKNIFLKKIFKIILGISFIFLLISNILLSQSNDTANRRLESCGIDINNNSEYCKKEINNKNILINNLKQMASTSKEQY